MVWVDLLQRLQPNIRPLITLTPPFSFSIKSSRNDVFRQVGSPIRAFLFCLDATVPDLAVRPALVRLRALGM